MGKEIFQTNKGQQTSVGYVPVCFCHALARCVKLFVTCLLMEKFVPCMMHGMSFFIFEHCVLE
jgi:hypothetical protein